jgi:hypothetical protein
MSATLTIRADGQLREALERRAGLQGKTLSELVRQILSEAVLESPLQARIGHLQGQLDQDSDAPPSMERWREQLRERNWRE